MENIGYIGLSQQIALQQQMEVVANNIANMSTPGYKSQQVHFTDYVTDPARTREGRGSPLSQAYNYKTYRDLSAGPMQLTSNPLDVAIQGDGYFAVRMQDGSTAYTRDGSFMLSPTRDVVTKDGLQVLSGGGGAINIPAGATRITITPNGDVATEDGLISTVKLVTFGDKDQSLKRIGQNLYVTDPANEKPAVKASLKQGALEGSNVNAISEMTRMTEILRAYQSAQNMQSSDHERLRKMIGTLTKTA